MCGWVVVVCGEEEGTKGVSPALPLIVGAAVAGAAFPTLETREETTMLAPEHFTVVVLAVGARCRT